MTEPERLARNAARRTELQPWFAEMITETISMLEARFRPRIQSAWRSRADQLAAVASGHSKLRFGFHNVTMRDGQPAAIAVDLLDDDHPDDTVSRRYLLCVLGAARAQGLTTGALFGLSKSLRSATEQAADIALARDEVDAYVKISWDPTHIEPVGITPKQAQAAIDVQEA